MATCRYCGKSAGIFSRAHNECDEKLFHCATASVKIPYSKLIGMTPYSDGLELHKEESRPKRTIFQGFDSWFIMNVINNV